FTPQDEIATIEEARADIKKIRERKEGKKGFSFLPAKKDNKKGSDEPENFDDAPIITDEMLDNTPSAEEIKNKKKEAMGEIITAVSRIEKTDEDYVLPSVGLLDNIKKRENANGQKELEKTAEKLIKTLASFKIDVKIVDYAVGPTVTRYELQPSAGVKISKITNLADDIALNLAAQGVRIEAPIPGKAAIGIEVPNKTPANVGLKEVLVTKEFKSTNSKIAFCLGKNIAGAPIIADIARMPHLLIAGSTGSGKSVCINALITSILYRAKPSEVKMILIDPKRVELSGYNGIPHLLIPVVTDPHKAAGALAWAVKEMVGRYKQFEEAGARDIRSYNELVLKKKIDAQKMPQVVVIIDELADLMAVAPADVEESVHRLSSMARAAGMHLVVATQRPSVDVITGIIKANIPSRISFAVSSQIDSRTILDQAGAEKLIGRGDMLYAPLGANKPQRIQGCHVGDKEVERVVNYVKSTSEAVYDDEVSQEIDRFEISRPGNKANAANADSYDKLDDRFEEAVELILVRGQASTSMFQRMMGVGYQRGSKLIDQLEERGIIGPNIGTKAREVLINRQQFLEMRENGAFDDVVDEA
ncbi:DNA translocase FtsK, partial [Treponema sp. R6D11]